MTNSTLGRLPVHLVATTTPPLPRAKERKLLENIYSKGPGWETDEETLVLSNLRLVIYIASKYRPSNAVDFDDLVAEGIIGLQRAIRGFNPTSAKNTLATYATHWVRQRMSLYTLKHSRTVRIPSNVIGMLSRIRRVADQLCQESGSEPTCGDIAQALGIRPAAVEKMLAMDVTVVSIDDADRESGQQPLLAVICDSSDGADFVADRGDSLLAILEMVDGLGTTESMVIRRRFGIDGQEPETLKQIGARIGVSRERIRQIEAKAIRRLREALGRAENRALHGASKFFEERAA